MNKKKVMALVLAAATALSPVTAFAAQPVEGADVAERSSEAAPEWQEYNNLVAQSKPRQILRNVKK